LVIHGKFPIAMDALKNPYAPGAGYQPPELAGRDAVRQEIATAIARTRMRRAARSYLLVGLRGVGKTVLLDRLRADADNAGILSIRAETPENRSLPALLAPQLRLALLRLSRNENARELARRGLHALAGFAKALKLRYHDIEVGLDLQSEPGLADNGDLENDLAVLLQQVGEAAAAASTAVVLFLDEVQYLEEEQFGALIAGLHRCAQLNLPVMMVGAGLPQLRAMAGNAKSYAERLFTFPAIDRLEHNEAIKALAVPATEEDVSFTPEALEEILRQTQGYPYFLQEWGKHAWDLAPQSPINVLDVKESSEQAITALDESFFRVRFDRLTPKEKLYLRAMADLGPGPHRSGDIAARLKKSVGQLGTVRDRLIVKGMIWSPSHGDTAFTVPLFDEFMKRIMPESDWE
jgi:hypothetical protein